MITCKKSDEETGHQEQGEPADKKYATDKSPLLADSREYVVVMDGSRRQKTKFDLRVLRFESLSRPAT